MASPFAIKITDFGGMVPRRAATLLENTGAERAANCRLLSGALDGLHQLRPVEDLSGSDYYEGTGAPEYAAVVGVSPDDFVWKPFENPDTKVARGPVTNDEFNRYYWTGDGEPRYNTEERIRNGDASLLLGIPAPDATLTVSPAGATPQAARAYTYTFVSPYGEEGPPAAPTVATGGEGTWALSGFDNDIPRIDERAPNGTGPDLTDKWRIRVYRTVAGETATQYYYVDEFAFVQGGTMTYDDTLSSDLVVFNSVLESEDWEAPPADLDYMILHPNGFLLGFVGTDVFMSVPFRPHAWPQEHVLTTEFPVVAMGIFGQSVAVATRSNPYVLSGVTPLAMTFTKTTAVTPCMSRYSIVSFDYGVVFATERGLVLVDGTGAEVITEELIIGGQWKTQYKPEDIRASVRYDDQYIAFYSENEGFIFSPKEKAAWSLLDQFTRIGTMIHNDLTGRVHMIRSGVLYEWDSPVMPPVQYVWKSKVFDFKKYINLGAARIYLYAAGEASDPDYEADVVQAHNEAVWAKAPVYGLAHVGQNGIGDNYVYRDFVSDVSPKRNPFAGSPLIVEGLGLGLDTARLRVWADENLVLDTLVYGEELVSLPDGFKAQRWQFELASYQRIGSFSWGTSPEALDAA